MSKLFLYPGVIFFSLNRKNYVSNLIRNKTIIIDKFALNLLKQVNGINLQDLISKYPKKRRYIFTLINYLLKNEFITDKNLPELFRIMLQNKLNKRFDGICYLEITRGCNLACSWCFNSSGISKKRELKLRDWKKILKLIKQFGRPTIIVTGGEPLTKKYALDLLKASSKDFDTYLFTNGTLVTSSVAKKLKRTGVKAIKLSIYGSNSLTNDMLRGKRNAFKKAVEGTKNLVKEELFPIWQITVSKQNIKNIFEIIKLGKSLGVKEFGISIFGALGRGKRKKDWLLTPSEEFKFYLELDKIEKKENIKLVRDCSFCAPTESWRISLAKNKKYARNASFLRNSACDVGIDRVHFTFDGYLSFCPLLCADEFKIKRFNKIRSIKEELLNSKVVKKFLVPLDEDPSCKRCGLRHICYGFCRGETYSNYGSVYGCNVHYKKYLKHLIRRGLK